MSKPATARTSGKRPPGRTLSARTLSPANREALRWLDEWAKTPAVESPTFWRDFERELRQSRMSLRKPK